MPHGMAALSPEMERSLNASLQGLEAVQLSVELYFAEQNAEHFKRTSDQLKRAGLRVVPYEEGGNLPTLNITVSVFDNTEKSKHDFTTQSILLEDVVQLRNIRIGNSETRYAPTWGAFRLIDRFDQPPTQESLFGALKAETADFIAAWRQANNDSPSVRSNSSGGKATLSREVTEEAHYFVLYGLTTIRLCVQVAISGKYVQADRHLKKVVEQLQRAGLKIDHNNTYDPNIPMYDIGVNAIPVSDAAWNIHTRSLLHEHVSLLRNGGTCVATTWGVNKYTNRLSHPKTQESLANALADEISDFIVAWQRSNDDSPTARNKPSQN